MGQKERIINWIITILTGLTVLLQYILTHLPKSTIILLLITMPVLSQHSFRSYVFTNNVQMVPPKTPPPPQPSNVKKVISLNDFQTKSLKDSSLFFGPSVSCELYSHEFKSGKTNYGIMPGIGYGLKWNPYHWKFAYLLGIDLFASGGIVNQTANTSGSFFNIQIVPLVSFLGYFHIGYGYRWKLGIAGNQNENTGVLVTGASVPLP